MVTNLSCIIFKYYHVLYAFLQIQELNTLEAQLEPTPFLDLAPDEIFNTNIVRNICKGLLDS